MSFCTRTRELSEEEAKEILRKEGPPENIVDHIEALQVAVRVLGDRATMKDIWEWAEN